MLLRERRREVNKHVYLARVFAAGLNIPEKLMQVWSEMLSLEVFHDNYNPTVVDAKTRALRELETQTRGRIEQNQSLMKKLSDLEVRQDSEMRGATQEELEEFKRRIRQRHLKQTPK